ncbi:phage tail tube protein [Bordetella sp. BOR01]|uniref:phage tail protein n=1 Tax=Bordetella sp. BOR01 TaxID=2854779 RepID=UPI001C47E542|nr:phage tail tube protein [Bordetella sp. BOR01]MBV7482526.1 Ig-like domain-containing protein [Bordetella sp. BOR01]
MAVCKNKKYVGRDVVLEYVIGCGDVLPAANEWKRFGAMRTKEFTAEWDSTDATADDSIGSLRENLATFLSLTMSGDGTLTLTGEGAANLKEMTKHFLNPVATSGQPVAWFRMTFPDLTFTAFMLLTSFSRSAPFDDVATYSMEATATASDFGLIVEDTPDPDAPAVTSVQVVPDTLPLEVGQTYDVEAVALPTSASQAITWSSSDTEVATVNAVTGVVIAVDAGTATITATSSADPTKTDTCALTVTAA